MLSAFLQGYASYREAERMRVGEASYPQPFRLWPGIDILTPGLKKIPGYPLGWRASSALKFEKIIPFSVRTLPIIRLIFPGTAKRPSSQVLMFIYGIRIDNNPMYLTVFAFKNNPVPKSEMM
jgi:hypothetical protein